MYCLASIILQYDFNVSANWSANIASQSGAPLVEMRYPNETCTLFTQSYVEMNYTLRYYDPAFIIPMPMTVISTIMVNTVNQGDVYVPSFASNQFIELRFTNGYLITLGYYPYDPVAKTHGGPRIKSINLKVPVDTWIVVVFSAENKDDNTCEYMIGVYDKSTDLYSYSNGTLDSNILYASSYEDSNQDHRSDLIYMTNTGYYTVKMSSFVVLNESYVHGQAPQLKCTSGICKVCSFQYNTNTGQCSESISEKLVIISVLALLFILT